MRVFGFPCYVYGSQLTLSSTWRRNPVAPTKKVWNELEHTSKVELLKQLNDDEIVQSYQPSDTTESDFRKLLAEERAIWQPRLLGAAKTAGAPPNKEAI